MERFESPSTQDSRIFGPPPARTWLSLWVEPSWQEWQRFDLVEAWRSPSGLADEPPLVHHWVWDQLHDRSRRHDPLYGLRHLGQPFPTVRHHTVEAPEELFADLKLQLSLLSVPVLGIHGVSLDGTGLGMEVRLHGLCLSLRASLGPGPDESLPEWQSWHSASISRLESHFEGL